MSTKQDEVWLFVAEWFDPMPQLKKLFVLKYFVDMQSVEMVDVKSKKLFLKKTKIPPEVSESDFFVGSKVNLFNRELEIIDYGDLKTKAKLQHQNQSTVLLLSSQCYSAWGKIIDALVNKFNFTMTRMTTFLTSSNASQSVIGGILRNRSAQYSNLSSGVNLCLSLHGENAYARLQDPNSDILTEINQIAPSALNVTLFACDSEQSTSDLISCIFGGSQQGSNSNSPTPATGQTRSQVSTNTATFDNCTCCVIKPHAVKAKFFGSIIDMIIAQGYEISALKTLSFDRVQAAEFLEVYDGVIPDYQDHVIQLSNGMSIALEIRCENAVETFRVTAGPWDVDMAKELFPESIRGTFGLDKPRSAIHCTDLSQDGQLECEYCFKIL